MIFSKKRITQALICLCGCAGWSAPLLFTNTKDRFSRVEILYHTLRDFRNAPFYIQCHFHVVNLRMFSLSLLSSCTMDHDLQYYRLLYAVHYDEIPTLMFFNNCFLTNVNLIQFENNLKTNTLSWQPDVLTNGKTQKVSEIIVLFYSNSQRFFANVSLKFSNSNNRRITFAHIAILLSIMHLIEEYLFSN